MIIELTFKKIRDNKEAVDLGKKDVLSMSFGMTNLLNSRNSSTPLI